MKKIVVLIAITLSSVSGSAQNSNATKLEKLKWLTGEWTRTNAKPGRSGTETWITLSNGEFGGNAVSMKGADTLLLEKFKLMVKQNEIYYVAEVPENKEPVYFKLTSITEDSFVCENPNHDFPKVISYKNEGDKMKASISGNGKSIDYLFERKH